jgi:hypothetical protein
VWGSSTGVEALAVEPPGRTEFWVADRGSDRLLGLDRDLFITESITMRAPTRLAPAPGGGVFVANAAEGWPGGAHVLRYMCPGADVRWERSIGPLVDLQSDGRDAVLVEAQRAGEARCTVLSVGPAGVLRRVVAGDVLCAARRAESFLVGFESGLLQLWAGDATYPLAEVDVGGSVTDIALARDAGWWILSRRAGAGTQLALLDAALATRWARTTIAGAVAVIPGAGAQAWCATGERGPLRRYGPGGDAELEVESILMTLDRGVALSDGGLLWLAPGALLRLDAEGLVRPGQGGFGFLADVIEARLDP